MGNGFEPAPAGVQRQSTAGKSSLRLVMNACNAAAGGGVRGGISVGTGVVRGGATPLRTGDGAGGTRPPLMPFSEDAVKGPGRHRSTTRVALSLFSLSPPLPDAAILILAFSKRLFRLARMILRRALKAVTTAPGRQAAVALIGPRQVGKTTSPATSRGGRERCTWTSNRRPIGRSSPTRGCSCPNTKTAWSLSMRSTAPPGCSRSCAASSTRAGSAATGPVAS